LSADPAFLEAFDAVPVGGYGGTYGGRRYRITKSRYAEVRSQKLEAEELGGTDYVSLNLYRLSSGMAILNPCEMPEAKVRDFVLRVVVD